MKKLFVLSITIFLLMARVAQSQIIPVIDSTFKCKVAHRSWGDIIPMQNGNILVVDGDSTYLDSMPSWGEFIPLSVIDPNGKLLHYNKFGPFLDGFKVELQHDGKILVLYNNMDSLDNELIYTIRLHPDLSVDSISSLDSSFYKFQFHRITKVSSSGAIYVANRTKIQGEPWIVKFHPDGTVDSSFHNKMYSAALNHPGTYLTGIEILSNGKLLLYGGHNGVGGGLDPSVLPMVVDTTGEEDTITVFSDGFNFQYDRMFKQRDGKIVGFSLGIESGWTTGPYYTNKFIRFNEDLTKDLSFTTGVGPEIEGYDFGTPSSITEDDEGGLIISVGTKIYRLNPNGSIDHSYALQQYFNSSQIFGKAFYQPGRGLIFGSGSIGAGPNSFSIRRFGFSHNPGATVSTINRIEGTIFRNQNNNCTQELGEKGLKYRWLKTQPGDYWTCSDQDGRFSILADSGSYIIKQVLPPMPHTGEIQFCPGTLGSVVHFGSQQNVTSSNNNFSNTVVECSSLSVSVASDRRRRCFRNNTRILISNVGLATAPAGSKVHLRLPKYIRLISSSQSFIYTPWDSIYSFTLDSIAPGQHKLIHVVDSVACIPGLMGVEQCTKTWVTPGNTCIPNPADWDGVDLHVSATCFNNKPRFKIENTGNAMPGGRVYSIYIDSMLAYTNMFQLATNFSMVVTVPQASPNQTVRLEVSQSANHPTSTFRSASISCSTGLSLPGGGFFPQSDESPVEAMACMPIRDSYDPNDKAVYPRGSSSAGNVLPNRPFNYTIRFQNKGNDTAFSVVVVDSIDAGFNPATLEMGVCSHPYTMKLGGKGRPVLTWVFEGINLPDSTSNESKSHGYINFQIRPYDSLALGTQLRNFADIYFDFNDPIRTNTTLNTLFVPTVTPGLIDSVDVFTPVRAPLTARDIRLYPNPNRGKFNIEGDEKFMVRVFSLAGKCLLIKPEENYHNLDLSKYGAGLYLVETENQRGRLVQKVAVE